MLLHVVYTLVFAVFSNLSSAQDVPCSITQDGRLTRYSVPDFTATECYYSWSNASDHVLANQEDRVDELVKMKTDRTLVTSRCLTEVHYKRDCISEKTLRTSTCNANCTGGPETIKGDGDKPKPEIPRSHWIAPVVIAVLLLLVLLGCLCYWIYTSKKKPYSPPSSIDDGESGESGESW